MTRRRRGLVRAVLRLGFLTLVAGAAWCAYDVASTDPARAAEEPPAATQDGPAARTADLVRGLLTPVLAPAPPAPDPVPPPPPRTADPPVADPSRPPSPDGDPMRPEPAPPTGDAPPESPRPPAPPDQALPGEHPEPPADAGPAEPPTPPADGRPPQDTAPPPEPTPPAGRAPLSTDPTTPSPAPSEPASPRGGPGQVDEEPPADRLAGVPAPGRQDGRSAEAVARLLAPLPDAVRDEVTAVITAAGPLTVPLIVFLEELLGPTSPLGSIVADLDPVLPDLTPILDLLEPVLDVLDPVLGLPQPDPTPTDPTPDPDPATPPVPGEDPALPELPDPIDLGPGTAPLVRSAEHVTGHRSGHSPAGQQRATEGIVDGGPADRDRQAERTPGQSPLSPAPATSGAEQAPISPSGPADTAATVWSPPPASGRVTRLARTRRRPSRSPRPRSRPA
ncbi:hypothetical protein [Micromonospora sp. NPDC049891]|uniref:hypothetical protein n=1 Tax=Micromonospora sp. NPDC049891 TaxID=3155655 RepID=UPI0033D763C1